MAKGRDDFAGDWERSYDVWRPGHDGLFNAIQATVVKALSWGPRPGTRWYEKRAQICAHLAQHPTNSVFTPEQLDEEDQRFAQLDLYERGEVQAVEADIIICLEVDDPQVTGAPGEILKFGKHAVIGPKIRLLLPKSPKTVSRRSFLHQAADAIPTDHSLLYTEKQYAACDHMRSKSWDWVEAVRKEKFLRNWRQGHAPESSSR